MKSKFMRSLMPRDLSISTTFPAGMQGGLLHAASDSMQGADDRLVQARQELEHEHQDGCSRQLLQIDKTKYADVCFCLKSGIWHQAA